MGKRDLFWDGVPTDGEDQISWPEDEQSRRDLVRGVFGATVIGALESVLEDGLAISRGDLPMPGSPDYEAEAARRNVFGAMSEVQRQQVQRLVREMCFGTLYWILVKLEHFPLADVDFKAMPFTREGREFAPVGIEETELHHLYFDWLERFADHRDR